MESLLTTARVELCEREVEKEDEVDISDSVHLEVSSINARHFYGKLPTLIILDDTVLQMHLSFLSGDNSFDDILKQVQCILPIYLLTFAFLKKAKCGSFLVSVKLKVDLCASLCFFLSKIYLGPHQKKKPAGAGQCYRL